jgi:hypothetical protein
MEKHMDALNPLAEHLLEWLPEIDVAVLGHGFAAHGRDYSFVIQDSTGPKPGTYELIFTHVVQFALETRVRDDVWPISWDDVFLDYQQWQAAGEPSGYLWGANWSLAYPGFEAPDDSPEALAWSQRLGKQMHAMSLETERFRIALIFHAVRVRRISDDTSTVSQVIIPIRSR